jgi:hypothetical protein
MKCLLVTDLIIIDGFIWTGEAIYGTLALHMRTLAVIVLPHS